MKTSIGSYFYSKREVKASLKGVKRELQVIVLLKERNKNCSRRSRKGISGQSSTQKGEIGAPREGDSGQCSTQR